MGNAWSAIDRLLIRWKYDLSDKIKQEIFPAVAVWILLCGCTTWTLMRRMEKKLDENYARRLHAVLNKSWKDHSIKQLLYDHLPPITQAIQVR